MKRLFLLLLALGLAGCGFLSNEQYFEGVGRVQGTLVVDGEPASGALVFVLDEDGILELGRSDANGDFDVAGRAGRGLKLVALWGTGFGLQHKFDLAGEAHRKLGELGLETVGEVSGQVEVPLGDPSWAQVAVVGTPFVAHPQTDGRFSLLLPPGKWSLEVSAPGAETERTDDVEVRSTKSTSTGTSAPGEDPDYTCDGTETQVDTFHQGGTGALDVLFVIDNSNSMAGEQLTLATSFGVFSHLLALGGVDFHIAVITTGIKSDVCPSCPLDNPSYFSCINETGEAGRFQDVVGRNIGTVDDPDFEFVADEECRVVTPSMLPCFFDEQTGSGTVMVGVRGCGIERGLAAVRLALSDPLLSGYNAGFLRSYARLAVVVVSDEEDCGEVDDVSEDISPLGGKACYYAAKGVGPDGSTEDPDGKAYALTPVGEYAAFLRAFKSSPSMATFSAIVGVENPDDPAATTITYASDSYDAEPNFACEVPDCADSCDPGDQGCIASCHAFPGTRYIALADMTGGVVGTICQADFSGPLARIAGVTTGYTNTFRLRRRPTDSNTISVLVDSQTVASGWSYSDTDQTVVFDEDSVPRAYASVRIQYETECPE